MQDRQIQVYVDFDAKLRERMKALLTPALIAEHAARPLGQHSDALERVLAYFRRQPQAGKYIIVATKPWQEYAIGVLSGVRGQPATIAWCGALAHEGYANNVSRMTANVLRRFLRDEPLPAIE